MTAGDDPGDARAPSYQRADEIVDDLSAELVALSHQIAETPELALEEHESARALVDALRSGGFSVAVGSGGLPTAFRAHLGSGSLTLAFIAEYDALPEIGHACGHNIIAAAAVGAARALAPLAASLDLTVLVIGTPAEESLGGKIRLMQAGVFDDVDAALMIHAGPKDIADPRTLALEQVEVEFHGRAAHASQGAAAGVNAADATVLTQVAIGMLRGRMTLDQRLAGIVTHAGDSTNVIPSVARMVYDLRAADGDSLDWLRERFDACVDAGSVATGAAAQRSVRTPRYLELRADPGLAERALHHLRALGRSDAIGQAPLPASTDMGNVSHRIPSIHPILQVGDGTVGPHERAFASLCVGPDGDRAVLDGARLLARTGIDAATDRALRDALRDRGAVGHGRAPDVGAADANPEDARDDH